MNQAVTPLALEVRGLAKLFERPAVDGLDLSVAAGEFYTPLEPSGAGKTITMRMVTGLLKPDRGSIAVYGIDAPPRRHHRKACQPRLTRLIPSPTLAGSVSPDHVHSQSLVSVDRHAVAQIPAVENRHSETPPTALHEEPRPCKNSRPQDPTSLGLCPNGINCGNCRN
jgi:ABC-type cobalamin/Fe3+-siderophores transport system ATPase subunit